MGCYNPAKFHTDRCKVSSVRGKLASRSENASARVTHAQTGGQPENIMSPAHRWMDGWRNKNRSQAVLLATGPVRNPVSK